MTPKLLSAAGRHVRAQDGPLCPPVILQLISVADGHASPRGESLPAPVTPQLLSAAGRNVRAQGGSLVLL